MNLGSGGIHLVSGDACSICTAARQCAPAVALAGADLIENARAHLLVALVVGLRRDVVPLCAGCKQKIEALAASIRRGAS